MKKEKKELVIAIKAMVGIVAITIVAESLIMGLLDAVGISKHTALAIFADAALLAVVVAPPIYWLVVRPLRREYKKRVQAESVAEDMSRLAITDPLTHIMNRRGITMGLLEAMAQAERYNTPLTVAMIDIDHFKQVNDEFGHKAGDRVLADLAAILADSLRMPDKVGRYGGEEFLIVLPHTNLTQGRKIAERIRAAVGVGRFSVGAKNAKLTVSIGLTQFQKGEDLEQLQSRADQALYEAKGGGRNQVVSSKKRA